MECQSQRFQRPLILPAPAEAPAATAAHVDDRRASGTAAVRKQKPRHLAVPGFLHTYVGYSHTISAGSYAQIEHLKRKTNQTTETYLIKNTIFVKAEDTESLSR